MRRAAPLRKSGDLARQAAQVAHRFLVFVGKLDGGGCGTGTLRGLFSHDFRWQVRVRQRTSVRTRDACRIFVRSRDC